MRNLIFILFFIIGTSTSVLAQNYDAAVGLRGGYGFGVTAKMSLDGQNAIEAIANFQYRGLTVTGLYERHFAIKEVAGLQWYIGGGAHVGFYAYYSNSPFFAEQSNGTFFALGADGIIGLEYTFNQYPINIGLDWKPAFNIIGGGFFADQGALSIRYVL